MTKLVLFDIDGTLLDPAGVGRRAMLAAMERVFGTTGPADGYRMAGKVDTQIVTELLRAAGLDDARIRTTLPTYWAHYVAELRRIIGEHPVRVLPGVRALLERLREHPQVVLGLLTGNIRAAAWIKLAAVSLAEYFDEMGAFGDEAHSRPELPVIAARRAAERFGKEFRGKDIVIVGDTPADIQCGQTVGAKTIAVATGPYSCETLRQHNPDYCFPDLQDTEAVLAAILDPKGFENP